MASESEGARWMRKDGEGGRRQRRTVRDLRLEGGIDPEEAAVHVAGVKLVTSMYEYAARISHSAITSSIRCYRHYGHVSQVS